MIATSSIDQGAWQSEAGEVRYLELTPSTMGAGDLARAWDAQVKEVFDRWSASVNSGSRFSADSFPLSRQTSTRRIENIRVIKRESSGPLPFPED